MKEIKIASYREVIHKAYDLSIKYFAFVNQEDGQATDSDDLFESITRYQTRIRQSELYRYLDGLDIETVKVIEAVMYIGRDYPFTVEECKQLEIDQNYFEKEIDVDFSYGQESQMEENPNTILAEEMGRLNQGEKESKTIIINRILEKAPLSNYIKRGIKILEI